MDIQIVVSVVAFFLVVCLVEFVVSQFKNKPNKTLTQHGATCDYKRSENKPSLLRNY